MDSYLYPSEETITAIATPLGEGGVAIVRLSGPQAVAISDRLFTGSVPSYSSHTAHYGSLKTIAGEFLDDVLILPMRSPRSFTGEDVVEIHCHGGALITRRILDAVIQAGARAAAPGEFTFRAFMNGKLDLTQAEAIQDLIGAKNEKALDAAETQLQGRLSEQIHYFQTTLSHTAAILEAWVDFPEEGLEFASREEILTSLQESATTIQKLLDTYHDGHIIHTGLTISLAGSPNVGKSSLMNALLNKERAIVSEVPGTTRDTLEDQIRLHGLNFRLIDTAGIRETTEKIELEGIRRTHAAMEEADLILFVLDASSPLSSSDEKQLSTLPPNRTIAIWNKIDLPTAHNSPLPLAHTVSLSAKTKQGLETLHKEIDAIIWKKGPPSKEEILITNTRHFEALTDAHQHLLKVIDGLQTGTSAEFVTFDIRQCLTSLGKIIGTDVTEDILSSIFANFCVGK